MNEDRRPARRPSPGLLAAVLALTLLAGVGCRTAPDADGPSLTRVRARLEKEPARLMPLMAISGYDMQVAERVFQALMQFDPVDERLVPQLAAAQPRVEQLPGGGVRYVFALRDGARWQDGRPVTPDDVVFTYQALAYPGFAHPALRGSVRELTDVRVGPGPREVTVEAAAVTLNGVAAYGNVPILPRHVYDAEGALAGLSIAELLAADAPEVLPEGARRFADEARTAPFGRETVVGSGPYRLADWQPGVRLRLVRDSAYWAAELPGAVFLARPDTLDYLPVPDGEAAVAMLLNGDLDVVNNVAAREAARLRDEEPSVEVYTPLTRTRTFVYLNTADPLLADVRTRRALAHLLDVEGFLRDVQLGFGEALHGPYHPREDYAAAGARPVAFDVDRARSLLAEAGWRDGDGDGVVERVRDGRTETLELDYLYPASSEASEALALLYAQDAAAAGVRLRPVGKEFGALIGDLSQRTFQLVQGAVASDPLPEDPYGLWHTGSDTPRGKNRAGFGDAASDALIDSIRVNLDAAARAGQYARLADMIHAEQPVIFLIVPQERIAVWAGLEPMLTTRRPGYYPPGFRLADDAAAELATEAIRRTAN